MTCRRCLPTLLLCFSLLATTPTNGHAVGAEPQQWALVIGISGYPHFQNPLKFAGKDAQAFSDFIQTPAGGAFPKKNIILLRDRDATRDAILDKIDYLGRYVQKEDTVYIYFSGHGKPDPQDRVYFMPYDGDETRPAGRGFQTADFLRRLKDAMDPKHMVLFIDACHAGSALTENGSQKGAESNLTQSLEKEWRKVFGTQSATQMGFFSASSGQKSWEDENLQHGIFTYYLLDAMGRAVEPGADGGVLAGDVKRYIDEQVEQHSQRQFRMRQTPIVSPNFDPNFKLALRPNPAPILNVELAQKPIELAQKPIELAQKPIEYTIYERLSGNQIGEYTTIYIEGERVGSFNLGPRNSSAKIRAIVPSQGRYRYRIEGMIDLSESALFGYRSRRYIELGEGSIDVRPGSKFGLAMAIDGRFARIVLHAVK